MLPAGLGKRDIVTFGQGYTGIVDEVFESAMRDTYLARVTVFKRPEHGAYKVGAMYLFPLGELRRQGNLDHEPALARLLV